MAGFVSELLIDTPEVLAENPDPTHLDETVTPSLVRDVRSINIALEAWRVDVEAKV